MRTFGDGSREDWPMTLALATLIGLWSASHDYTSAEVGARRASAIRVSVREPHAAQWIQPGDVNNSQRIAIPVPLGPTGSGSKLGIVRQIHDVAHLNLYIQAAGDGTLTAFVRNPEQNAGAYIGVRTVALKGTTILLQRAGQPDITGYWSAQSPDQLILNDPGLPGSFQFARQAPEPSPTPYRYHEPAVDGDGWPVGNLQGSGIDPVAIGHILDAIHATVPALRAPYIQGLLIARHGKLVLDEYFNGFDADRPHDVRSAGKSVTTLMIGRAIEDGAAFSPQTLLASILQAYRPFGNPDARKEAITVGDLMSMSGGYACDDNDDSSPGNENHMQAQTGQPDWYRYTLDLPMLFAPGTKALYCTAEINLLGAVLKRETGRWLPDYFYDRFARPMQFGSYGMWLMPPPVDDAYMGGGDLFRPRDFLKFGQLFLDGGRWNGSLVVQPAWLRLVSSKHSYIAQDGGDYGYGWHLSTYPYGGRTVRAISAGGNGGQLLYAFPDLDLTVMITAGNYNQYPVWRTYQSQLIPSILAAVSR